MRIVGINGSHRKDSNTGMMVSAALEACSGRGFDVEQIDLWDRKIGYCTVCGKCRGSYCCSIDDDVMDILDRMKSADAILVASPTYFGDVSARLKSLFDRTLPLRRNSMLLSGKVGAGFATGGSRNGGQEKVISQIHSWMLIHQMSVVGDRETAHFGGICVSNKPGSVVDDVEGMTTVLNTAENVCDVLSKNR